MRIRLNKSLDAAVVVDDHGSIEVLNLSPTQARTAARYIPAEAPRQHFIGYPLIEVDPKHPYVVFLANVPAFAASSTRPARVVVMMARGIPAEAFTILDTRDGRRYSIAEVD